MTVRLIHSDSLDLLVTAAVGGSIAAGTDKNLAGPAVSADHLGQQQLQAANAAAVAEMSPATAAPAPNRRQPIAEPVALTLDEEMSLQLERTKISFVDASCNQTGWHDSPACHCTDGLAAAIRDRLERSLAGPQEMALTSEKLNTTAADWRRTTIYIRDDLGDAHTQS